MIDRVPPPLVPSPGPAPATGPSPRRAWARLLRASTAEEPTPRTGPERPAATPPSASPSPGADRTSGEAALVHAPRALLNAPISRGPRLAPPLITPDANGERPALSATMDLDAARTRLPTSGHHRTVDQVVGAHDTDRLASGTLRDLLG